MLYSVGNLWLNATFPIQRSSLVWTPLCIQSSLTWRLSYLSLLRKKNDRYLKLIVEQCSKTNTPRYHTYMTMEHLHCSRFTDHQPDGRGGEDGKDAQVHPGERLPSHNTRRCPRGSPPVSLVSIPGPSASDMLTMLSHRHQRCCKCRSKRVVQVT